MAESVTTPPSPTTAALEAAVEALHGAAWEWDLAADRLAWTPAMGPLFGLPAGSAPSGSEEMAALVHPEDRARVGAATRRAIENGTGYEVRFRALWPDGSIHWVLAAGRVLHDDAGAPVALAGAALPIDADDDLARRSPDGERLFRQFAEVAPVLIWKADAEGACTFLSRAWLAFTGTEHADQLGDGWLRCVHPDDVERMGAEWREAQAARRPFELEYRLRRHDGVWRRVVDRGRPIEGPDGAFQGWVGGAVDLHERTEAADDLRLLASVGRTLVGALDVEEALAEVERLAGAALGGPCRVVLGDAPAETPPEAVSASVAARGRTLGTLTVVPGPETSRERAQRAAGELAARVGLAVDNAQLLRTARAERRASVESGALLDALLERAPVGFASLDADLHFTRVNAALARMLGRPEDEVLGRAFADVVPPAARPLAADLRRVLATGRPVLDARATIPGRDGERHFVVSTYRVRLPDGETLGLGVTALDVTDRRRGEEALRAQRDLYDTLLRVQSELGEGFVLLEGERILYVNDAAARLVGRPAHELYALPSFRDIVAPGSLAEVDARVAAVLAEDVVEAGFEADVLRGDGSRVTLEVAGKALEIDGVRRLTVIIRDVTPRRAEREERERLLVAERTSRQAFERAHARSAVYAEVSGIVERSLDLRQACEAVARLLTRGLADIASVDVLDRDRAIVQRVAIAARDPMRDEVFGRSRGLTYLPAHEHVAGRAILTGEEVLTPRISLEALHAMPHPEGSFDDLVMAAPRSGLGLPLLARGHIVGALGLGWVATAEPSAEDLETLREIARRVALGIDNAQLYAERAQIAATLQAGLLPPQLPAIPGAEIAARYRPADDALAVGGDFYDVVACGAPGEGPRWAVVVGDVCGKGAEAAALTAMARYTLRAAIATGQAPGPAEAFAFLNGTMVAEGLADRFLSAVVAFVAPGPAGLDVELACAGHPAPVHVRAGAGAKAATATGILLGIDPAAAWVPERLHVAPGEAIALYTDGVTETDRSAPLTAAELAAALPPGAGHGDAAALADAVVDLATQRAPHGELRDDIAVLALRAR